mgnify:CR=1 FL=1
MRSSKSEFSYYPLVVSEQKNGVCNEVFGPASSFGVSRSIETKAAAVCKKLSLKLNYTGVFAIEFFYTKTGKLLVNEIAPRVHNTGHITMNASETSQFENHWRAILGLPLGSTKATARRYVMKNILGELPAKIPTGKKVFFHWYGKKDPRPGRKMGHINILD